MRYSLVVYLNNEYFEIVGISKLTGFEHINETKLKDIVEFTNSFVDEQDMISFLIETGLLPRKFSNGTVQINYFKGKNSVPKTLQYGISFEEDKKFFDTIFLKYFYREKLTNPEFMKAFLDKYYSYLKDVNIFSEELNYLRYCFEYYQTHGMLPKNADYTMSAFVEVYCRKKSKDGYYKADFTRIRDLAMFAINYERNHERPIIKKPQITTEEIEMQIDHYEELMRNNTLTIEEQEVYATAISKLEKELEFTRQTTLNRRNKNEITRN